MRTYEIIDDANGAVIRTEEVDDAIRPAMLAGQSARLLELDGDRLAKSSRPIIGPGAADGDAPTMPETLLTEDDAKAAREAAKAEREAKKADKTE